MKSKINLVTLYALLGLTGCSFSGYDASSQFACKAPEGVLCSRMDRESVDIGVESSLTFSGSHRTRGYTLEIEDDGRPGFLDQPVALRQAIDRVIRIEGGDMLHERLAPLLERHLPLADVARRT